MFRCWMQGDICMWQQTCCITNKSIFCMTRLIKCDWWFVVDPHLSSAHEQRMPEAVKELLLWATSTRRGQCLAVLSRVHEAERTSVVSWLDLKFLSITFKCAGVGSTDVEPLLIRWLWQHADKILICVCMCVCDFIIRKIIGVRTGAVFHRGLVMFLIFVSLFSCSSSRLLFKTQCEETYFWVTPPGFGEILTIS